MRDDRVVSLTGEPLPSPGEPVAEVCKAVKALRERAEAGDVVGAVIAVTHADGAHSYDIAGHVSSYGLVGAVTAALNRLLRLL